MEVRKLADQRAVQLGARNVSHSWHQNNSASLDWFQNYMRRNSSEFKDSRSDISY